MSVIQELLRGNVSLNIQTFLVLVCFFLLAVQTVRWLNTPGKLPPGPRGFPILGVLPLMGKKPHLTIQKWWEKYGDMYSLYMGSRLVVIINGVEAMRECFVKQGEIFSGRPWNYFRKLTRNRGIVFTEGDVWLEHRRFTLSCLRDFGMGRVCLEEKIQEEIRYMLFEIALEDGKPFVFLKHFPKAVSNIICSIIYGSRFDYNDEVFKANIVRLDDSVRHQSLLGMIQFLPFLEFLPKILPKDKMLSNNVKQREEYAHFQVEKHAETVDPNSPRDFIDAYLTRMQQMKQKGEHTTFDDDQLKRTIQDLFIAGSETINTTLKWALLFMITHPEVQDRVQREIDEVVGQGRMPSMKDRLKMPYTDATIMECQRLGNIALFSVPRCTVEDTEVQGYKIPRGTWVFVNRWGAHASTKYWKRPKAFDPTRFLDKEGKVVKPEAFVPFGMGPRSCIGEALAKMELFIFFTAILQAFKLRLPEGSTVPSLEPCVGINMCPQPYSISAVPR